MSESRIRRLHPLLAPLPLNHLGEDSAATPSLPTGAGFGPEEGEEEIPVHFSTPHYPPPPEKELKKEEEEEVLLPQPHRQPPTPHRQPPTLRRRGPEEGRAASSEIA